MTDDLSSSVRLIAMLDHLGLGNAHIVAQLPGDIAELAVEHSDRLGGIVLCAPFFLDPAPFIQVADRVLMGPTFDVTVRAATRLPGAERHVLDSYEAQTWSDIAAEAAPRWRKPITPSRKMASRSDIWAREGKRYRWSVAFPINFAERSSARTQPMDRDKRAVRSTSARSSAGSAATRWPI